VRVLKCPNGDYRAGASFNLAEFRDGLRAGIWPLGMIIRAEDGDIVAVCGKGSEYREPAERLPRQWVEALT
jgi:hypothetical protein